MVAGWLVLVGAPLVAALTWRAPDAAVAAYGSPLPTPLGRVAAAAGVGAVVAALLLLLGTRGAPRYRAGPLTRISRAAGWTLVAVLAFTAAVAVVLVSGPLGMILGAGLLIIGFSLVRRGSGVDPNYRPGGGRARPRADEV